LCPIGERTTNYLTVKKGEVEETLEEGAKSASEEAKKNMNEIMRLMKVV
jgi:hypothetical protein